MTQSATTRSLYRTLPGHVYTPEGPGRETESLEVPHTLQQFTLTFGGVSPLAAGDYVTTFVTPANGSIEVTVNSDGTKTFAAATDELAASINANSEGLQPLLYATSNGTTTVTLVAKSANLDLATPTTSVPGADTLTAAETVAPAAPTLRMGLWYVYGTPAYVGAITGTPRGARLAALPAGAAVADLRGVVARAVNQTTLSTDFVDSTAHDAYRAGQIAWGCLRGEVCCVVDPASTTMAIGSQVHVVVAAGTYSVIGAVAAAADGGNTVRLDNTVPVRARVTAVEETLTMGGYSARLVVLKVNQTN